MSEGPGATVIFVTLHVLIQLALITRVLLRPHRQPASRIAWIVFIIAVPVVGIVMNTMVGGTNIGRGRVERRRKILDRLPNAGDLAGEDGNNLHAVVPQRHAHLFQVGQSINGFNPVSGNHARLMKDPNSTIEQMVTDIDSAKGSVHLLFYVWLPDNNGSRIVEALKRAAARGIICRAMADSHGSHSIIHSEHWRAMDRAGVQLAVALPIGTDGAHRPAQSSQDRRHRQFHHLLRKSELRRSGVSCQGEIRTVGGRYDALRGPHCPPEPVPVHCGLDG